MVEQMRISEPPAPSGGRGSPDGVAVIPGWVGHALPASAVLRGRKQDDAFMCVTGGIQVFGRNARQQDHHARGSHAPASRPILLRVGREA
jgi:hypothetical protein